MDLQMATYVVRDLGSPHAVLRQAACDCARSLSRSVAALRTTLVEANVAEPLLKVRPMSLARRGYW
jgi:armadillo repeat-containing protein 8